MAIAEILLGLRVDGL